MTLSLPHFEEVPLQRPPVTEVICQVRFPPILRISAEGPYQFQDRIREHFPTFEILQDMLVQAAPLPAQAIMPVYHFKSPDGRSVAALAVNFFAFSTEAYSSWIDFRKNLTLIARLVRETYSPASAGRIGLRFVNKLTPHNTGFAGLDQLVHMLTDELIVLYSPPSWTKAERLETRVVVPDGEATLNLRLVIDPEPYVVLDFDYYEARDNIPLDELIQKLDRYHDTIYSAFRWSVAQDALAAFLPREP